MERIQVLPSAELIASKVAAYRSRINAPKAGTDWRYLGMLLLRFPELKVVDGEVAKLLAARVTDDIHCMTIWNELVHRDFSFDEDSDLTF